MIQGGTRSSGVGPTYIHQPTCNCLCMYIHSYLPTYLHVHLHTYIPISFYLSADYIA